MELFRTQTLDPALLAQVRRLVFQTRHLAEQGLGGQYRSAFRGRGIEFEELREYFPGDEIRSIDWKVTARSRKAFVKSYREERELTVMVAVDISASTRTGTTKLLREELIARVGAILTLIALNNNDNVGLVTYSDRVETFHPPRKARSAVWRILHDVLSPQGESARTDLAGLCSFLSRVLKRSSIVFVISDFFDSGFSQELAILAKRHDVTAVVVRDPVDLALPALPLLKVSDPETGQVRLLDGSNAEVRQAYQEQSQEARDDLRQTLRRAQVGQLELSTAQEFIDQLKRYFYARKLNPQRRVTIFNQ